MGLRWAAVSGLCNGMTPPKESLGLQSRYIYPNGCLTLAGPANHRKKRETSLCLMKKGWAPENDTPRYGGVSEMEASSQSRR